MWTEPTPGRWTRPGGYLLAGGPILAELHDDPPHATVHLYHHNPNADPKWFVGSPLDGYTAMRSTPVPRADIPDAAAVWAYLAGAAKGI